MIMEMDRVLSIDRSNLTGNFLELRDLRCLSIFIIYYFYHYYIENPPLGHVPFFGFCRE